MARTRNQTRRELLREIARLVQELAELGVSDEEDRAPRSDPRCRSNSRPQPAFQVGDTVVLTRTGDSFKGREGTVIGPRGVTSWYIVLQRKASESRPPQIYRTTPHLRLVAEPAT